MGNLSRHDRRASRLDLQVFVGPLGFVGEEGNHVFGQHMPVAGLVAEPGQGFKPGHSKGPVAKVITLGKGIELPPQHQGHFLHHVPGVVARGHQPPHEGRRAGSLVVNSRRNRS